MAVVAHSAAAFEVTGAVKDVAGNPIKATTIWLCQDHEVAKTETDSLGAFSFQKAKAQPAQIVARKEGYELGGAEVNVLGPRNVDLVLGESATTILRIVDGDYRPLAGATVKALGINGKFVIPVADLVAHGFPSLRSDDAGLVPLSGLPKGGNFGVAVYHPKFAETRLPHLPVAEKQQPLRLYPGVPVRGRVVDPNGKPLARARVSVYRTGISGYREYADRLTDREGYYNAVVVPGEYLVAARHPDYAAPESQSVAPKESDTERIADFRLVSPHGLSGTVLGPDGNPLGGVTLRYLIRDRTYGELMTCDDGSYEMKIPPGEGAVRVAPPPGLTPDYAGDIRVTVEKVGSTKMEPIRLKKLPSVDGIVVGPDQEPQADVLISSKNLDPPLWALTDEKGRFHIQLGYAPSDPKASFRAEHGLRFQRKDFDVDLRQPHPSNVLLEDFEPDLNRPAPIPGGNDLTEVLDGRAPEPVVDAWFNSDPFTLDQLRGKVVVLTLWGGFDDVGPGRDRMFELCALHALLKDAGDVLFWGIHDNGSEIYEIQQYIDGYGIKFPVARDVEKFTTFARYLTKVIPQTVLIDKKGRVRYYQVDGRLLELIKSLRREG